MRIALLGHSYHWREYEKVLEGVSGSAVVAVAPGSAHESLEGFAGARGIGDDVARYEHPLKMLDEARPDVVVVSTAFEALGKYIMAAVERGIALITEKPLAIDLETLSKVAAAVSQHDGRLYAIQGMMGHRAFHAGYEAVRDGRVGEPYAGYHQKSYMWNPRPDTWKNRETFPGLLPWVGIHALAWMHWVLGDVFTEVSGYEGGALHPETPACATQAGCVLGMNNGGYMLLSVDYLRPKTAPTHGDERMRVAGSRGVVEVFAVEDRAVLIDEEGPRDVRPRDEVAPGSVRFVRSLRGECEPPVTSRDVLRITEIALRAQQAVESGRPVSLESMV